MRKIWPVVALVIVGCCADIYRGADIPKVVLDEHTTFIEQQMALLKEGQPAEMVRLLGERARDSDKFEKNRDRAQALLETALRVGGAMVSYQIIEAQKIKEESDSAGDHSADHGADTKPATEGQKVMQQGVVVRLEVKFERATAKLGYTFFIVNGVWRTAGLQIEVWGKTQ
jgi:hypothetical protein